MTRLRLPLAKIAIFSAFLIFGLWMAQTIHDPFQGTKLAESPSSQFSIESNPSGQYRLLLVVVDKITAKPMLQSAWWIGSRADMPTAMVAVYPNVTLQLFRDTELEQAFRLTGLLGSKKPDEKFVSLLDEWEIHWNDYLVIDVAVESSIIDYFGGVMIGGSLLSGKEATAQVKKLSGSTEQLTYYSRLWSALCSLASQQPEGFNLNVLPLNLDNHVLTSIKPSQEKQLILFSFRPTFPVCMVNSGLMEAAVPPFLATK